MYKLVCEHQTVPFKAFESTLVPKTILCVFVEMSALDACFHGHCLSVEQRAAIKSALLKVRLAEDLANVTFWGQIQGTEKDYFIARALTFEDEIKKQFFVRCCVLPMLQQVTVCVIKYCRCAVLIKV